MEAKRRLILGGAGAAILAVSGCLILAGPRASEAERASGRGPSLGEESGLRDPHSGPAAFTEESTDPTAARGPASPGRATAPISAAERERIAALKAAADERRARSREAHRLRHLQHEAERTAKRIEREEKWGGVPRLKRTSPEPLFPTLDLGPPIYGVPGYPDKPDDDDPQNPDAGR